MGCKVYIVGILNIIYPIFKYLKSYKRYKNLRFSIYITIIFMVTFILGVIIQLRIQLSYILLFFVTLGFIILVRKIKNKSDNNQKINEFEFLLYMGSFGFILIAYIITFSLFYFHATLLGNGYMIKDNSFNPLDRLNAIYFSGFTFFSMEFDELQPQGILKLITLLEVFLANIIIISFIGILSSELLKILKLKKIN